MRTIHRITRLSTMALIAWVMAFGLALPAQAAVRAYRIYSTDGYVTMPDNNVVYSFGFNDTGIKGQIQFPSPLIWGNVGDEIQITMTNLGFEYRPDLVDPHTVHLHGVHVVPYYDGFPEASFAIPEGESFTYKFMAEREGTFIYHCHVEAVEHVQMGMYGPLVIYKGNQTRIYGRNYLKEYIWLLSEFDTRWHRSLEPGAIPPAIPDIDQTVPPIGYDEWVRINYRPDYWLINGLAFPDTIRTSAELPILTYAPNTTIVAGIQQGIKVANGLPAHPGLQQSALVDVRTDEPTLVRIINMGFQAHPLHLHGQHYEIVGTDAAPLPHLQMVDSSGVRPVLEKFTILVGSGETYDTIVKFSKKHLCDSQALVPKPEESPFPGETAPLYDPNGPYFFPAHCHDDHHATNQGVYPGGMTTLLKVARPVCRSAM